VSIPFLKTEAAGNDFLVFDDRAGQLDSLPAARWADLCRRRTGVGADGVLLLQTDPRTDFRMRYLNADGGEAGMCGNGARCLAWAAAVEFNLGRAPDAAALRPAGWEPPAGIDGWSIWSLGFTAADGAHFALGWESTVVVSLRHPSPPVACRLPLAAGSVTGQQVDTGVPHLVVRVADPDRVVPEREGPPLRAHPDLGPAGANVDWLATAPDPDGAWRLRTFERGVEGETLACGTGAGAAAAVLAASGVPSPVILRTRGGEALRVYFTVRGERIAGLWLEGPVRLVYRGSLGEV
jgi:diaminopimelate epimerase